MGPASQRASSTQISTKFSRNSRAQIPKHGMKRFCWQCWLPADTPIVEEAAIKPRGSHTVERAPLCVSCCEENVEIVCVPCGHACLCTACANIWKKQKEDCPICRQKAPLFQALRFQSESEEVHVHAVLLELHRAACAETRDALSEVKSVTSQLMKLQGTQALETQSLLQTATDLLHESRNVYDTHLNIRSLPITLVHDATQTSLPASRESSPPRSLLVEYGD